MTDDRIIAIVWIVGGLALVSAGLVHRFADWRGALGLAMLWIGIIAGAWGVAALVQRLLHG